LTTRFGSDGEAEPGELPAQLYLVKSDGSEVRPLLKTAGRYGFYGRLSPDGRRALYLARTKGGHRLFVVDVDGGAPVLVSQHADVQINGYSWCPDGERIAYAWQKADGSPSRFIVVVGRDGKGASTILVGEHEAPLVVADWRVVPEWPAGEGLGKQAQPHDVQIAPDLTPDKQNQWPPSDLKGARDRQNKQNQRPPSDRKGARDRQTRTPNRGPA